MSTASTPYPNSFEEQSPIIVGLDIGTTKVVAVAGTLNKDGRVSILGLGHAESEGVSRGTVDNIARTVDAIDKAVQKCADQAHLEIDEVFVSIGGEHIRAFQEQSIITTANREQEISDVDVERVVEEMRKIALPPSTDILHIIPQNYCVDGLPNVKDPIGMPGVRLQGYFHIITAQSTARMNLQRCLQQAHLQLSGLVLQPLASSLAVLTEEERENGVCLVDIGGGTSDVMIYEDGILRHTAVIPLGGSSATNDIKQGCSVMRKQAEFLKVRYGSALEREIVEDEVLSFSPMKDRPKRDILRSTLARIIQARMEEIFDLVLKEIHLAGMERRLSAGIVVTGGGAQLAHLPHLVEYVTGIDCRVGYPNEYVGQGLVEEISNPMFATATGLVLYGLQQQQLRINASLQPRRNQMTAQKQTISAAEAPRQQGSRLVDSVRSGFTSFFKTGPGLE
jgi:cell division protein FtsA